jgi:hypothetical protein
MRRFLQLLALIIVSAIGVKADISVILDAPNQTGQPGSVLQFFGTITNTGVGTVFLNGDSIDFTGASSFSTTDLFFSTVPISLGGGLSSGDIELFDFSLSNPFTDALGSYEGSYTLIGGADGNAQDVLATENFSVTAQAAPEPGYYGVLALGISGLLIAVRHRRRASSVN